jgi:hypothetical protein
MTPATPGAQATVSDARVVFNYYLEATSAPSFRRIGLQCHDGSFVYPETTCQVDAAAFAGAFNCLWRALETRTTFNYYYTAKTAAFAELVRIVTPNKADPCGFTAHARFWTMGVQMPIEGAKGVRLLCRTLRNGFAHFNFRYINVAPSRYFLQMNLALPTHIPQPDVANNYRIFICDWNKDRAGFMDPESDTRIIETHFAHLRYHLFMFLARFFTEPDREPYRDILTGRPIA